MVIGTQIHNAKLKLNDKEVDIQVEISIKGEFILLNEKEWSLEVEPVIKYTEKVEIPIPNKENIFLIKCEKDNLYKFVIDANPVTKLKQLQEGNYHNLNIIACCEYDPLYHIDLIAKYNILAMNKWISLDKNTLDDLIFELARRRLLPKKEDRSTGSLSEIKESGFPSEEKEVSVHLVPEIEKKLPSEGEEKYLSREKLNRFMRDSAKLLTCYPQFSAFLDESYYFIDISRGVLAKENELCLFRLFTFSDEIEICGILSNFGFTNIEELSLTAEDILINISEVKDFSPYERYSPVRCSIKDFFSRLPSKAIKLNIKMGKYFELVRTQELFLKKATLVISIPNIIEIYRKTDAADLSMILCNKVCIARQKGWLYHYNILDLNFLMTHQLVRIAESDILLPEELYFKFIINGLIEALKTSDEIRADVIKYYRVYAYGTQGNEFHFLKFSEVVSLSDSNVANFTDKY
jgi:hypothetical protein